MKTHIINVLANEEEYNELVAVLDYLFGTSDLDEQSPASALVDIIGDLIESYENANVPELSTIRNTKSHSIRTVPANRKLKTA